MAWNFFFNFSIFEEADVELHRNYLWLILYDSRAGDLRPHLLHLVEAQATTVRMPLHYNSLA